MVKVDTNSWHCRLLDFKDVYFDDYVGYSRPRTLCSYFWRVVFAPLQMALVWMLTTTVWLFGVEEDDYGNLCIKYKLAFWGMLITSASIFYIGIPMMYAFEVSQLYEAVALVAAAGIIIGCLIGVWAKLDTMYDNRDRSNEGESFTSLVWQTVKAAKKKVCPLMEYHD